MYKSTLNHPKFEYCVYCKVKNGKPYIIPGIEMSNMVEVSNFLKELEEKHKRLSTSYYVDNDFYQNKYSANEKGTYYKVLKRPIADWEEVSCETEEIEEKKQKNTCKRNSSIIYLIQQVFSF